MLPPEFAQEAAAPLVPQTSSDMPELPTVPTAPQLSAIPIAPELPATAHELPTTAPELPGPAAPELPLISPVPPLPTQEPPGSPFNLPGLEQAFPMKPTGLGGVSVLSVPAAAEAARRLGLKTDFSAPAASRLADGSVVLSAPTTAVSLAHVSAGCVDVLSSAETQQLVKQTLDLIAAFRRAPLDDAVATRLADALQALKRAQLQACDAALGAAVQDARATFGKLRAAVNQKTAAELTHLRHADDFRALKRDLRALGDVVQADARSATSAREKLEAFKRQALPQTATTLAFIVTRLRQMQDLAQRTR